MMGIYEPVVASASFLNPKIRDKDVHLYINSPGGSIDSAAWQFAIR